MSELSTFAVTGLTCEHCVATVSKALGALDDVESVAVELAPRGESMVTVVAAQPLDRRVVRSVLAARGYRLAS